MKVLLLSCNTGGGHNSAAKAIAEELLTHGEEAYVLDYLCLAGNGVSKLVGDGYVQIVKKTPLLFGLIYKLGMVISRLTRKSPVYYINGCMAKYLNSYLKEHPTDVLIMPHLYPAETVTYMKRKGMDLPVTIAVMTDYTCIPFWEETDCDHYILPHEALRKSCIKKGIPNEKIQTFGIPVAKNCRLKISKEEAQKRAMEMMELLGINNVEKRMKQYPHEFSGGMRQRVMIAMGLICHPQLLIADEPTTALDVTIQAQILDLMKDLQKKTGMGIIFITHNLGVVADICDKVSVMYAGKIVEQGPVDDIFYEPAHPYTKGLLRSMPRVDAESYERLIPIEGTPVDMLNPPEGCPFAPRCEHCMKICLKKMPPYVEVGEKHRSACWLRVQELMNKEEK